MPYNNDLRDLIESMTKFYVSGAGKSGWSIPDISHVKNMMAANYNGKYFRVLITGSVTEDVVIGLHIDYGTSSEIAIRDLRWLKKDFLTLPVQSIYVRIRGIIEEDIFDTKQKLHTMA